MLFELNGVTHLYNQGQETGSEALSNIKLHLRKGEFLGLAGASGSGKSTLVQVLNGLIKPTKGTIYFEGKKLWTEELSMAELRKRVGVAFQQPEQQLFAERVEDDLAFGPRNLGYSEQVTKDRVRKALAMVGLEPKLYLDRSPFSLSGGEQRRVALAGILAMEPEVLVLDEPTAGLDHLGKVNTLELIKNLHLQGKTIVMVSHEMDHLAELAERLVILRKGQVFMEGQPDEVFAREDLVNQAGLLLPCSAQIMVELQKRGWRVGSPKHKEIATAILGTLRGRDGA